jgi:hypothetical protein
VCDVDVVCCGLQLDDQVDHYHVPDRRSWQDLFCTPNQLNKVWHVWPGSNDFRSFIKPLIGKPLDVGHEAIGCRSSAKTSIDPVELADVAIHSHVGHL